MLYDDDNRGSIQFPDRARQLIDFSGLRYNKITPTDIDGFIEYHDEAIVFMEFKYGNAELPYGQKLALERLCDSTQKSGKETVVFECEHNVDDCSKDIKAADAIVRRYRYKGHWYPGKQATVKEKLDSFISYVNNPFRKN